MSSGWDTSASFIPQKRDTINNRIDTMKIGVVDVENRSVLPVSTFKLPERVEPKIGNLPALHTVQRLGRNNWTGWAPEKLNLTDLDLIKDEHQNMVSQIYVTLSNI